MYSEFDNVSFLGASNQPLSRSNKNSSKLIPMEFMSRWPIFGTLDELENTTVKLAVAMEQKEEDTTIPPPSSSSSSSSEYQINIEERSGEAAAAKDGDGYQTPTSPRHTIPLAIKCPPAPKKPKIRKRWQCKRIKSGTGRVRRRIEIGSAPCADSDDLSPRKKKVRGEATADP